MRMLNHAIEDATDFGGFMDKITKKGSRDERAKRSDPLAYKPPKRRGETRQQYRDRIRMASVK
jgi:hypothetical protein